MAQAEEDFTDLPQRLESIKLDKYHGTPWHRVLAHFNCILRDHSSRYYSETLDVNYFGSEIEYKHYLNLIKPNKPINLNDIKIKFESGKYESNIKQFIDDVELVFINARNASINPDEFNTSQRMITLWIAMIKGNEKVNYFTIKHVCIKYLCTRIL